VNIVTKPFKWISAHREATFTFDYEHVYDLVAVAESDGTAVFIFDGDGINALEGGEYLFIDSGEYEGYHKVTELLYANYYVTETDYTTTQTTGTLTFIEDHVFKIGFGFDYPPELTAVLPYGAIEDARFKPEPNLDGQLVVNISGYINKIFDVINSNDTVEIGGVPVYYNLFNRVVLFIDDVIVSEHIALNSAITQYELNRDYVDTGRDLNGGNLGNLYLSCGDSESIQIVGDYVTQPTSYTPDPAPITKVFKPSDFDPTQFLTE